MESVYSVGMSLLGISFQLSKQKLSMCLGFFGSEGTKVMGWIYEYQTEDFRVSLIIRFTDNNLNFGDK